jgi:hypothetical protein
MKSIQPASRPTGWASPKNLAYYSIICAVGALLLLPIPFMVLGLVFGILAIRRGEARLGAVGLVLSIPLGLLGWVAAGNRFSA